MKINIIGEVGLNHLGKNKNLIKYIKKFKNTGLDGLSLQILQKNNVAKDLKKFCLKKKDIRKFITETKKNYKYAGIAIHTWDDFKFLKEIKPDFIKILASSFGNLKYFKNLRLFYKKKIFFSIGGKKISEIHKFLKKINNKKLSLIYTFFKSENFDKSLKKIQQIKRFNIPVAYGNHFKNINYIPKVKKYNPSEIFFYIKMLNNVVYPDNTHAVPLNKIEKIIKKIKND